MTTTIDRNTAMWMEAGVQFRSNVCRVGEVIGLHAHSYDHVSLVTAGWFEVTETTPDGTAHVYQLAAKDFRLKSGSALPFAPVGYRITIPAGHQHTFACLGGDPAEILCLWADGFDQHTEGEDSC